VGVVQVADISKTCNDRFAAAVRRSLRRKHGIRKGVTAVFSSELAPKESMAQVDGVKYAALC
jgi:tRNA A37 threonylcarbamoyladenosine dehydratase